MSEIRVNSIGNESNTGGPELSGITEFSGQQYFIPPKGTTAERPSGCPAGSIRFNTDTAHLEYWNGLVWLEFEASSEELGDQNNTNSTGGTGHRGLFMGGGPSVSDTIDYISISTLGNAQDFGNLSQARWTGGSAASSTRAVAAGGETGSIVNTIDFGTFASTGNFSDFGDLATGMGQGVGGASSSTRGVFFGGGAPSKSNVIQYISIASEGNSVDYGDLSYTADAQTEGICGSPIRGIAAGGNTGSKINNISYITLTTLGNAVDFGDLTLARGTAGSGSNATRGIFAGGEPTTNIIDFITISTTGNAQDFGDLQTASFSRAGVSSPTRACFGGGGTPTVVNTIDFITIPTTGNASDFGDLTRTNRGMMSCSNGHGGL